MALVGLCTGDNRHSESKIFHAELDDLFLKMREMYLLSLSVARHLDDAKKDV